MVRFFTVSKKGGNNGAAWNGVHPEKFFSKMHLEGVKEIWDVRRISNGGGIFDANIMKWCCAHEGINFISHLDFAPEEKVFTACNKEHWDLFTYAKAYFTDKIVDALNKVEAAESLNGVAILGAEQELYNCHRLLISEYFRAKFPQIDVDHLGLAYDRFGCEKNGVSGDVLEKTRTFIQELQAS